MKYYSEVQMADLRLAFENKILTLPEVRMKRMFGCPCYQANGNLFAFLVTNGVVITQLEEKNRDELAREGKFFRAGKKVVRNWIEFSIKNTIDLKRVLPVVRQSYRIALRKARMAKRVQGLIGNGT